MKKVILKLNLFCISACLLAFASTAAYAKCGEVYQMAADTQERHFLELAKIAESDCEKLDELEKLVVRREKLAEAENVLIRFEALTDATAELAEPSRDEIYLALRNLMSVFGPDANNELTLLASSDILAKHLLCPAETCKPLLLPVRPGDPVKYKSIRGLVQAVSDVAQRSTVSSAYEEYRLFISNAFQQINNYSEDVQLKLRHALQFATCRQAQEGKADDLGYTVPEHMHNWISTGFKCDTGALVSDRVYLRWKRENYAYLFAAN